MYGCKSRRYARGTPVYGSTVGNEACHARSEWIRAQTTNEWHDRVPSSKQPKRKLKAYKTQPRRSQERA